MKYSFNKKIIAITGAANGIGRAASILLESEGAQIIAIDKDNKALGFVQLYETFGSLDLGKIVILYDLYVKEEYRKNNIGRELMLTSHSYAKKIGAKRIQLSTAIDNSIGQSLYESLGYIKDKDFYTYDFEIE